MKMKKTKIVGLVLMLGLLLQSSVSQTYAAAAELEGNRVGPIDSSQECSLEIELSVEDKGNVTAIRGMKITIYRVAGLSEEGGSATYTPAAPFNTVSVDYTKLKDASASSQAAKKLSGVIGKADGIQAVTGQSGKAKFTDLEVGMYLVVQAEEKDGYTFDPFLISVPYPEKAASGDNVWNYEVSAQPKAGIKKEVTVTPTPTPKPISKTVQKSGSTTLVKTGDDTNLQYLISLMAVSLLGIGCAVIVKKRRSKLDPS